MSTHRGSVGGFRAGSTVLAVLVTCIACGAPPPRTAYVPPPPPPAVPKGPPARFHWATRPPDRGDLFVAIEGRCPFPNVGLIGHTTLLTYGLDPKGGPAKITTLARFTQEGLDDMSNGLPAVTLVDRIAGAYPTGLFLQEWGGAKSQPSDRIWRWRSAADGRPGWELALIPDPEHGFRIPVRWSGGYVAVEELSDPSSGVVNLSLRGLDLPDNVKAPDLIPPDFGLTDLIGFDSGELFAFGSRPSDSDTIWSIRWVTPSDHTVTVHTFGAASGKGELLAPTPDDVHVKVGGQYYQFDGGSWAPVPPLASATAWSPTLPAPDATMQVQNGHAWALSKGELLVWKGKGWTHAEIPPPAFSATGKFKITDLAVSTDGEAFVTASYSEKGPSWGDSIEYHAVLRSRRPYQTMRCNDVDPESGGGSSGVAGRGVQSWPPMADESCPTPFVVLARRSNAHPQAPDYAPLRLPLRGHPELDPVVIMDVPSGDHTYIGIPTKDLATAKKLIQVETRSLSLHAEIVCADPVPARAMAIDLRTGGILKEAATSGKPARRK